MSPLPNEEKFSREKILPSLSQSRTSSFASTKKKKKHEHIMQWLILELIEKSISLTGKGSLIKKRYLTWVLKNKNKYCQAGFSDRELQIIHGALKVHPMLEPKQNVRIGQKNRGSQIVVDQNYPEFLLKMQTSESYPRYYEVVNLAWSSKSGNLSLPYPYYSDEVRDRLHLETCFFTWAGFDVWSPYQHHRHHYLKTC